MERYRVTALPVVDEDRRVLGIVSQADLLLKEERPYPELAPLFEGRRHRSERRKAAGTVAAELMTVPAVTVGSSQSLAEAARLMHSRRVKHLPVVDAEGRIVGIVSRGDLLRIFLRADEDIVRDVEEMLGTVLGAERGTFQVRVREGMVTLHGTLRLRSSVTQAVALCYGVDGVVGVDDRLSYTVDDRPQPLMPMPM